VETLQQMKKNQKEILLKLNKLKFKNQLKDLTTN
jgi:hypothetical protein